MSYRLLAVKPEILYINGKGQTVTAGDCLHLSNVDAQALLASPISSSFVVIASDDPQDVTQLSSFTEGSATETVAPPQENSVLGSAVTDPLEEIYGEYKQDGEPLFASLQNPQSLPSTEPSLDPSPIAGFDSEIIRVLGETPNWKSLVNYVRELGTQSLPNLELINYIQQKYSSMGSVVNECKRVITSIQEKQIEEN
jgi:hypothetical protein